MWTAARLSTLQSGKPLGVLGCTRSRCEQPRAQAAVPGLHAAPALRLCERKKKKERKKKSVTSQGWSRTWVANRQNLPNLPHFGLVGVLPRKAQVVRDLCREGAGAGRGAGRGQVGPVQSRGRQGFSTGHAAAGGARRGKERGAGERRVGPRKQRGSVARGPRKQPLRQAEQGFRQGFWGTPGLA